MSSETQAVLASSHATSASTEEELDPSTLDVFVVEVSRDTDLSQLPEGAIPMLRLTPKESMQKLCSLREKK